VEMSPSDDVERHFNTAYSNSRMGYIFDAKVALNFARFEAPSVQMSESRGQ